MSQLIDMEAAREFMKETLDKVEKEHLIQSADALEYKSSMFKEQFNQQNLAKLSQVDFTELLRNIFSIRRKTDLLYETIPVAKLKDEIAALLHTDKPVDQRFQTFCDNLGELDDNLKYDFAGELLHYTYPEKYWLWCRWMWDPKNKTGAIPLVLSEEFDLDGQSLSEVYMKVGKGVAFVHSAAEPAEFQFINRSLFGTDVFLSCVYAIYTYTVLQMKMTKEFNEVMPGLIELTRRLLGVYGVSKAAVT
jgi:hypothetical protein